MSVEASSHVHIAPVLTTDSQYNHSLFYDITAPATLINMQGPPCTAHRDALAPAPPTPWATRYESRRLMTAL